MSAILSADDLNDFISPSVACIKPVETLPEAEKPSNPYEVTTEDAEAAAKAPPAQISLTDCLACSGCVTSAEAVLVSLQSYQEVLTTLDAYPEIPLPRTSSEGEWSDLAERDGKVFVATVSPQARASVAATFGVSERAAGHMIERLLSGEEGLRNEGAHGSGFTWVLDSNVFREIALVGAADELAAAQAISKTASGLGDFTTRTSAPKKPILTSACPGWICYAEKTHPHVLPHISKLKSPQAIAGTLIKSVLATKGIPPSKVFHMAIMPCFDKKLEASREEFTSPYWSHSTESSTDSSPARDVDLVITSRELLSLATARGINFPSLSHRPLSRSSQPPFPDPDLNARLFPHRKRTAVVTDAGSSGGYLHHILRTAQLRHPGSQLRMQRGRNADVVEYTLVSGPNGVDGSAPQQEKEGGPVLLRAARYYGFRNIQNLVRRLRPAKQSRMPGAAGRGGARRVGNGAGAGVKQEGVEGYDYVEVMACPGGCTNGGGQVKVQDVTEVRGEMNNGSEEKGVGGVGEIGELGQREWLARVDEAYFSGATSDGEDEEGDVEMEETSRVDEENLVVDGVSRREVEGFVKSWVECTGVEMERLLYTTYRKVESDVGKSANDVERVAGLASTIGGGW
ncbi:hypothetical protein B9Z65_2475 [Elsinoe australis]|uniref:Nuclear architecture-related protein 1 n=1 Tax=Elsinoe australis TaxID=40998 RepID=A0A2P7ZAW5_9PEZI|nr:hypothetical protein B9Z65_2475 [Elsinoe australis]